MNTIENKLRKLLEERGLFPEQVDTIMETYKAQTFNNVMKGRWSEDAGMYPPQLLNGLTVGLFSETLKWIDANKPRAWYRSLFIL